MGKPHQAHCDQHKGGGILLADAVKKRASRPASPLGQQKKVGIGEVHRSFWKGQLNSSLVRDRTCENSSLPQRLDSKRVSVHSDVAGRSIIPGLYSGVPSLALLQENNGDHLQAARNGQSLKLVLGVSHVAPLGALDVEHIRAVIPFG
ncbi:hypothetical protein VNO78_23419 [Psophocarpus tetragonolobus]|uniref:Uncharacterized protein n=1 Tax=Psophocarpus tetragonolobus TaxID=3891 RepID=A0AAN9S437_PSOTE